jgi:hypothetical protein
VVVVPDLRRRYETVMLDRGMTLGAIKYSGLLASRDVEQALRSGLA